MQSTGQMPQPGSLGNGRQTSELVENAWKVYAHAFEAWAEIGDNSFFNQDSEERTEAMRLAHGQRDLALFHYFEVFDADQRQRFGGVGLG